MWCIPLSRTRLMAFFRYWSILRARLQLGTRAKITWLQSYKFPANPFGSLELAKTNLERRDLRQKSTSIPHSRHPAICLISFPKQNKDRERKGARNKKRRTYHSHIHLIGVRVSEESLRDSQNGIAGRGLHMLPPRSCAHQPPPAAAAIPSCCCHRHSAVFPSPKPFRPLLRKHYRACSFLRLRLRSIARWRAESARSALGCEADRGDGDGGYTSLVNPSVCVRREQRVCGDR